MGRLGAPQLHPVLSGPARWRVHRPVVARGAGFAAVVARELKSGVAKIAQRRRRREAVIATATDRRRSLERLVSPSCR